MGNLLYEKVLQTFLESFIQEAFGDQASKLPFLTLKNLTRHAVVALLAKPFRGILPVLDIAWKEESIDSDFALSDVLRSHFGKGYDNPLFGLPRSPLPAREGDLGFVVEHFAETVDYDLTATCEYNTLSVPPKIIEALNASHKDVARRLKLGERLLQDESDNLGPWLTAISYHHSQLERLMDEIQSCKSIFHVLCCNPALKEPEPSRMTPTRHAIHMQLKRIGVSAAVNIYFAQPLQAWLVDAPGITEQGVLDDTTADLLNSVQPRPPLEQAYVLVVQSRCVEVAGVLQSLRDIYADAKRPLEGHMDLGKRDETYAWCLQQKSDRLGCLMGHFRVLLAEHVTTVTMGSSDAYLSGLTLHHLVVFTISQMVSRLGDMDPQRLEQLSLAVSRVIGFYRQGLEVTLERG